MSRIRSPNYPQIGLPEASRRVEEIRTKEGRNAASREVLAKLLGFGGLNGASMGVLSAISKYGLLEDAGDKELRVSDLADSILFPHNPEEKTAALQKAANSPALFAEINEKWPDRPPGDENLRAYLMRRGFSQKALDNVVACYRETMGLVTPEPDSYDASRNKGSETRPPMESTPSRRREVDTTVRPSGDPEERAPKANRIRAGLDDGVYEVNALLLDTDGFDRLIKILQVSRLLFEKHTERFDPETETWSKPTEIEAREGKS
jgi:hypothetical protein